MIARRRVLSFLGLAPIGAKAAADEIAGKLSGLNFTNGMGESRRRVGGHFPSDNEIPWEVRTSRAADFLRLSLPSWLEDEIRLDSHYVESLDPDLANKRSWSMAVKIADQRERNYRRRLKSMIDAGPQLTHRKMLSKLLGFDWPW